MTKLSRKYKELISYLFFGGCTTLVNILTYYVFTRFIQANTLISTALAWGISILFAYITNKLWVFESKTNTIKGVFIEFISFVLCRLISGALDIGIMYIFVDVLCMNDMLIKVISNIIVIIINYLASKLVIFKEHELVRDN